MKKCSLFLFIFVASTFANITIFINTDSEKKYVSPYLYGRNIYCNEDRGDINDLTDTLSAIEKENLKIYSEAGIRYLRMNNGNNSTKYNWRKNLSSHPDYYNNVYAHNWDKSAKKVLENLPNVDAMYGFQLTGYVASSTEYNFKDWDYKQAHGKNAPQNLNLAGGGEVDDSGNLIKAGNSLLYLEPWPADSTVGILNHWKDELKYDMNRLKYWSMDNEMEIWAVTHDDLPYEFPKGSTVAPERMIESYVAVAKAAKAIYSDIKLTGPVVANEWYWCNIRYEDGNTYVTASDRNYCWLEYFIKRLGEEQKKTNVQLLDVFDIHWYPTEKDYESWINWHRVFYDTTYNYPGANGIKRANKTAAWDETITKEYIFKRIDDWMNEYVGENYNYTFGLTETDFIADMDAMSRAVVYASFMGTFMEHGVEIFTPWTWREGMYETVHLFSRYGKEYYVKSTSTLDSLVSAYSTINKKGDSLTVILVNRSEKDSQIVDLQVEGIDVKNVEHKTLLLSEIERETFVSHSSNALKTDSLKVYANKATLTLPAKSITAILLAKTLPQTPILKQSKITEIFNLLIHENGSWFIDNSLGKISRVEIFTSLGQKVMSLNKLANGMTKISTDKFSKGSYLVRIQNQEQVYLKKILVK